MGLMAPLKTPMEPIRVQVTAEDIANGYPWNGCRCPVSLAIARTLDQPSVWLGSNAEAAWFWIIPGEGVYNGAATAEAWGVYNGMTILGPLARYYTVTLPPDVHAKIRDYDVNGTSMVPFTFELMVPLEVLKGGSRG